MAYRQTPFSVDEWYHCYNRGVDRRIVFEDSRDYRRFLEALYLSNAEETDARGTFQHLSHKEIMDLPRSSPIVSIGAYCLMPNHFHLLIKEIASNGISRFMHRLGTSYTMYFNIKKERTGNLFGKPFKAKHIADDNYLARIVQYIHLNPVELFERKWKEGTVNDIHTLGEQLHAYPYSSLAAYSRNAPNSIIDSLEIDLPDINHAFLSEAAAYYSDINMK